MKVVLLFALVAFALAQAPVTKPTHPQYHCKKVGNDWRVEHGAAARRLQAVQTYPMCPIKYSKKMPCAEKYDGNTAGSRRLQSVEMCEVNTFVCKKNATPTKKCADPLA